VLRISIIIPAYNAQPWIAESIGSVLAQTWRELEVIVVDDGSKDATPEIVAGIGDSRVRLIRQENQGQCAALNRGAAEAKGDFIKFVDADDWLNPEHLAAQVAALDGAPDCVASCRWGYFLDDPRRSAAREEHSNKDYEDPLEWLVDSLRKDEGMMGGWKWLIPRAVWERCGGWDERLSLNNDFDFSIRLLLASSGVRFAKGAVYAYRKGTTGALSGTTSRAAMQSAYWTTESGCQAMLERENSERIRRICANRWQEWLFKFYPEHPDLAGRTEGEVRRLGGSSVRMSGGGIQALLTPLIGWKGVRRLQSLVYHNGWQHVLRWKAARRLKTIARP
jgi:glycosyltransferase involved in cell wall biosynthesis